jgi:uncharacterized protein involved in tolerance to divalent cations
MMVRTSKSKWKRLKKTLIKMEKNYETPKLNFMEHYIKRHKIERKF